MFIGKHIFQVITRNHLSQVEYILGLYKLKLTLCLFHSSYKFKKRICNFIWTKNFKGIRSNQNYKSNNTGNYMKPMNLKKKGPRPNNLKYMK